jgi:hypothetical protein
MEEKSQGKTWVQTSPRNLKEEAEEVKKSEPLKQSARPTSPRIVISPRGATFGSQLTSASSTNIVQRNDTSLGITKNDTSRLLSLFFSEISYPAVFKQYQKSLTEYLAKTDNRDAIEFVTSLELHNKSKLDVAIFLEAIELVPIKLKVVEDEVVKMSGLIEMYHLAVYIGRSPKQWKENSVYLLNRYREHLKERLVAETGQVERDQLSIEIDHCLVLAVALGLVLDATVPWNEDKFFSELTEQQIYNSLQATLYNPNLTWLREIKKPSLEKLWKIFYDELSQRLSLTQLRVDKTQAEQISQEQQARYKALRQEIKRYCSLTSQHPWKQQLLYQQQMPTQRFGGKAGVVVRGYFQLNQKFVDERFRSFDQQHCSGLLGSTYFSMDKSNKEERTLCLDANYQSGSAGATADGYGHFATEEANIQIHQAAYRAVKLAVRYANLYDVPTRLFEDIPKLFRHLGHAVKYSFLHPEDCATTSCVLTKVFRNNNQTMQIVAAGVGDSLALVWDRKQKQISILIKPQQYERGGQLTPISITESLKGKMLQSCQVVVSDDSFILRMSDGAWELLKYSVSQKIRDIDVSKNYVEYNLDIKALDKIFHDFLVEFPDGSASNLCHFFRKIMQAQIVARKDKLVNQIKVIQDKFSAFNNDKVKTMDDLLKWSELHHVSYATLVTELVAMVGFDFESIKKASLSEFLQQLTKISIGDDVTLHVEALSEIKNDNRLQLSH